MSKQTKNKRIVRIIDQEVLTKEPTTLIGLFTWLFSKERLSESPLLDHKHKAYLKAKTLRKIAKRIKKNTKQAQITEELLNPIKPIKRVNKHKAHIEPKTAKSNETKGVYVKDKRKTTPKRQTRQKV